MVSFWGFGEGPLPGQQMATFLTHPHMAFPGLCMKKERQRERERGRRVREMVVRGEKERENYSLPLLIKLLTPSD